MTQVFTLDAVIGYRKLDKTEIQSQQPRRSSMHTLDKLAVGQRGRVTAMAGTDALTQRLYEMGLLEGEEIEVLGFAPLGDPMEIRLRDYRLSLRRNEAARITVTRL
jgi:ferrous iron transport protein A